jgi:hypothetical protein
MPYELFFKNGASEIIQELSETELQPLYTKHRSFLVDAYKHEPVGSTANGNTFEVVKLSTQEMRTLIQLQNKLYEQ